MKLSFRWYGESDPISLEYISQIPGMRSIVSAVYDVKPGEVWPEESLATVSYTHLDVYKRQVNSFQSIDTKAPEGAKGILRWMCQDGSPP